MSGGTGYLNSEDVTGDCCFVHGLNNQKGYAMENGAVWTVEYVEGKGWTIKNYATGKYLKDPSHPAMFDEPTYFTFCTLKETATGIEDVRRHQTTSDSNVYTLDGRKVNPENLRPGLYIKGGKKVLIK